ncbi:hypothetical protein CBS101457_005085 [Exobasidium rhododendri]|nr:hypothetical protein CBS101457_005085 [Exobasidium rhododendri]
MRSASLACLAALLPCAFAFPAYVDQVDKRLLSNPTAAVNNGAGLLSGILGGIAESVNPDDKRPDAAHPFIAPGPTDQRGPCPGLNTLANHGYLPRNGIVTAGQVEEAASEGFNMAADLSGLLNLVAVAFNGNLETETFSIGGEDDRTYSATGVGSKAAGRQYGLDTHSTCEGDVSATRNDYFLDNGDDHSGQPDRFRRYVELAKENGGLFNYNASNALYGQNAALSVANNPRLYFQGYTVVVVLGEYPFLPAFFSNGTYNAGGIPNYESLAPLMGYKYNANNDTFQYVPETFPENWYRRSIPYGIATPDGLVTNLAATFLAGTINLPNPLGALLTNHAQLPEIGCAIYQGISSGVPASLIGSSAERLSTIASYVESKLGPNLPTIFGCPTQPFNTTLPAGDDDGRELQATGPGGDQKYYASD